MLELEIMVVVRVVRCTYNTYRTATWRKDKPPSVNLMLSAHVWVLGTPKGNIPSNEDKEGAKLLGGTSKYKVLR